MKATMMLISLMAMGCIAHSLPVEPVDDEHVQVPLDPLMEEQLPSEETVRERRSPGGWQSGNGGENLPGSNPQDSRGSITGGVHRESGVGTVVHAQGQGNVWSSNDGNTRVDANGEWSKVVRGPARGKPNYNVGATFSHKF